MLVTEESVSWMQSAALSSMICFCLCFILFIVSAGSERCASSDSSNGRALRCPWLTTVSEAMCWV